jgi:hypothetical protein
MLLCGFISTILGKDIDWDLANYHYSNAYLFLHHHVNQDIFPPSYVHIHFAPTADFLSYFLINYFTPFQVTFISGAIHGLNLWLTFQIAYFFLKNTKYGIECSIVIALIGIYGCTIFFAIGNLKNDLLISIFILFFIFSQIKSLHYYDKYTKKSIQWLLIGGMSAGIAVGLKLTAAVYIAGTVVAYCCLPIRLIDRGKFIFILGCSSFIGFVLSSGYWMRTQWVEYHNPLFPFFNSIFYSPYYSPSNLFFPNTQPQNIWNQILFSPYLLFFNNQSKSVFIDLRYFYLYLLLIATGGLFVWNKYQKTPKKLPLEISWICFFVIFTHLFYQHYFDGLRYVAAIEMLIPLIIYLLVSHLVTPIKIQTCILFLVFITIIFGMKPNITGTRLKWYNNNYFNVTVPDTIKQTSEALALIPYSEYALSGDPRPIMFLTAFLPPHWHFAGIPFKHALYDTSDTISEIKIRNTIENYSGQIFFITPEPFLAALYDRALHFNLIPAGNCDEIENERSRALQQKVLICPVKKIKTSRYSIKYRF